MSARNTNELLSHEWAALASLWSRVKAATPQMDAGTVGAMDQMFADALTSMAGVQSWEAFNTAEMKVGESLDDANLRVEYQNLLDVAHARKLITYDRFASAQARIDSDTTTLTEKRATYQSLLYQLQSGFVETRLNRSLRKETAQRLLFFGLGAVIIAMIAPAVFIIDYWHLASDKAAAPRIAEWLFSAEPGFGLAIAASFGLLGAYFSRATAFRDMVATLGFEDVMTLYRPQMMMLRMMYGMVAGIILYYLLASGLMSGGLFPDLTKLAITEVAVKENHIPRLTTAGLTVLAPTTELAKLIIWSFIAGFSERLVGDALDATAGRFSAPGGTPAPPSPPAKPAPAAPGGTVTNAPPAANPAAPAVEI